MMYRTFLISLLLSTCSIIAYTQDSKPLSLSQCIRYAIEKNSSVKKAEINKDITTALITEKQYSYIPDLHIGEQNNFSTGRVLDPTSYDFITNKTVYDMNVAIGGSVTLFSGFGRRHNIKKAKMESISASFETEKIIDNLTLKITSLFLQILLDKEAIKLCLNKIDILQNQESVVARKVEYKTATYGDLLNIKADITNAHVDLSSAENSLNLDKVSICELMGIDDWGNFDIYSDENDYENVTPHLWCPEDIITSALSLPEIRQAELAIEIANKDIQIASSQFWPTLNLSAGYGSTYSNARKKNGGQDYTFRDQFRDNMSTYFTLSINIPLLNNIRTANSVKIKKLTSQRMEQDLIQTKRALSKEINHAILNANTAYEKYNLLSKDVDKFSEALRHTEEKYSAGAATYYDYQIALGNLFNAQGNQLQAKYEYIFRSKIIDFYVSRIIF